MCGIGGIVSWDDRFHISTEQLDAMSGRLAHRGPDGQGILLNHDREATSLHPQAGLVHRRLAVIDLDSRAEEMVKATPAKRAGTAEEIADAVLYFLNATNFTTGQLLAVDGGLSQR